MNLNSVNSVTVPSPSHSPLPDSHHQPICIDKGLIQQNKSQQSKRNWAQFNPSDSHHVEDKLGDNYKKVKGDYQCLTGTIERSLSNDSVEKIQNDNAMNDIDHCTRETSLISQGEKPAEQVNKSDSVYSESSSLNDSQKKLCTSMSLFYGKNSSEILFKFEYYEENMDELQTKVFTREEILQHDPRWILYFYENHLQFSKTPNFKPERLKRI